MTAQLPERYVDARVVGRGGMAEVWHARDARLDRDVAIKVLAATDGLESEDTRRARFEREARVVARLSAHPHVVTVYDVGETDGRPYLAMEWMGGGTLADRLAATPPIGSGELLDVLGRVASALDAAHADGIVHRDVKPGNILFDAAGTPRIADFGIATFAADPSVALTQAGAVIGTAAYIAPEQASGTGAEPASDQYALMAIAFEALAGERPFRRDNTIAELAAHVSDPVPDASTFEPALPPRIDDVFRRGLAKHPAERFASCSDAIDALRRELDRVPPTVAIGAASVAGTYVDTGAAAPSLDAPRGSRRRVGLVAAVAIVLLLAILVANAVGGGDGDGDDPEPPPATTTDTEPTTTEQAEPTTTEEEPAESPPTDTAADTSADTTDASTDTDPPTLSTDEAITRHEESFAALQAGDWQRAYDLGISALGSLGGVSPYEAYANYNVGAALVGLGRCDEALPYLDRSEQLQGQRDEIDQAAQQCIAGAGNNGKGNGNGGGKKDKGDD